MIDTILATVGLIPHTCRRQWLMSETRIGMYFWPDFESAAASSQIACPVFHLTSIRHNYVSGGQILHLLSKQNWLPTPHVLVVIHVAPARRAAPVAFMTL